MLAKIINAGVKPEQEKFLSRKIRLSNYVALLIAFGVAFPFVFISYIYFPPNTYLPVLAMVFALFSILLNHLGLNIPGRVLISVLPVALTAFYGANLSMVGEEPVVGIFMIQLSFSMVPFLVFDLRDKGYLIVLVFVEIIFLFLYDFLNGVFEVDMETEVIRSGFLSWVSIFLSSFFMFGGVLVLVWENFSSEKKSDELLSELDSERGKMKQSEEELKLNLEKIKEKQVEEEKRKWASEGIAQISGILRMDDSFEVVCDELIGYLVRYTNSTQGGIYLVNEDEENRTIIELKSMYAYDRKKFTEKVIYPGQGLIGQTYLEKECVHITEIPQDYLTITSGLGEANPGSLLIIPLITNEEVEGFIELASFKEYKEHEIKFLTEMGEGVASTVRNSRINDKTKLLLEQSQQQAEEMQAQEEEMRQNMEELEATQEEMQRNEKRHLDEIEELREQHKQNTDRYKMLSLVANNTDNSVIITGADGLIEYVNNGFEKLSGYKLKEIKGKKPGSFLQGKDTDPETVKRIRKKLDAKEPFYEEILNYDKAGTEYWISLSINPVFEKETLTNYVSVQADITDTKQKALDQGSQVEAVNRNLATIEFELDGTIRTANQNFLDSMGYDLNEITGKHHRMFMRPEDLGEEYDNMWKELAKGKSFTGEFQRINKKGEIVWLRSSYTPILNIIGEPYKIIKYAQDITESQTMAFDFNSQMNAINQNYAVIEFDLEGNIVTANDNFLKVMGYRKSEIVNKHHSMFVADEDLGEKYEKMWDELRQGKPIAGDFRRVNKSGEFVHLKSVYAPIINLNNEPYKVVKYAQHINDKDLALEDAK